MSIRSSPCCVAAQGFVNIDLLLLYLKICVCASRVRAPPPLNLQFTSGISLFLYCIWCYYHSFDQTVGPRSISSITSMSVCIVPCPLQVLMCIV